LRDARFLEESRGFLKLGEHRAMNRPGFLGDSVT
jgi:hypothetical protein